MGQKKDSHHTLPHLAGLKWMFVAPEELRADFQHLNRGYRKHGQASPSGSLGIDWGSMVLNWKRVRFQEEILYCEGGRILYCGRLSRETVVPHPWKGSVYLYTVMW